MNAEIYISVDVETAGPVPAEYALLSIGACLVDDPAEAFYGELQPDREQSQPEALQISGLSLESLKRNGHPPRQVLADFSTWVSKVVPSGSKPVFVALNAPFDWMFISDYFHRYLGSNPFGHSALDIKAYYMGIRGVDWFETSLKNISYFLENEKKLAHNALEDARDQANIFRELRALSKSKR